MKRFFLVTALAAVLALAVYFPAAILLKTSDAGTLVYFKNENFDDRWLESIPRNYGNAAIASAGIFSLIMIFNILAELRKGRK